MALVVDLKALPYTFPGEAEKKKDMKIIFKDNNKASVC